MLSSWTSESLLSHTARVVPAFPRLISRSADSSISRCIYDEFVTSHTVVPVSTEAVTPVFFSAYLPRIFNFQNRDELPWTSDSDLMDVSMTSPSQIERPVRPYVFSLEAT